MLNRPDQRSNRCVFPAYPPKLLLASSHNGLTEWVATALDYHVITGPDMKAINTARPGWFHGKNRCSLAIKHNQD